MNSPNKSVLKILLLGNMNNNFFSIARYLRDLGLDCTLGLFNDNMDHFHPSCSTFNLDYRDFTKQLSWGSASSFANVSSSVIFSDLKDFDVIFGCGLAPAYCLKAGRRVDFFIPYGDDIWNQTFYKLNSPQIIHSVWQSVFYQRKALANVKFWQMNKYSSVDKSFSPSGQTGYESQYERYGKGATRLSINIPMVYSPELLKAGSSELYTTHWSYLFKKIRDTSDFMIVCHNRHVYGDSSNPNSKGHDILLKGWKKFLGQNHNLISPKLVLLEYGRDISKSINLVKDLGIADNIVFLPKMLSKDIFYGLMLSDMVCGQFSFSTMACGTIFEGLAAGKPIIGNRDDKCYLNNYSSLYPMYNASNEEEVCSMLTKYISDKNTGVEIGLKGRKWYETEVVDKSIAVYHEYIKQRADQLNKRCYR